MLLSIDLPQGPRAVFLSNPCTSDRNPALCLGLQANQIRLESSPRLQALTTLSTLHPNSSTVTLDPPGLTANGMGGGGGAKWGRNETWLDLNPKCRVQGADVPRQAPRAEPWLSSAPATTFRPERNNKLRAPRPSKASTCRPPES